ncbi:hypothetical protein [Polaribacter sp.]|uniref:hypothetical protein n=1 Tax=Polaribacter sp. TaxID=1920175 RepID=UPI00404896CC
MKKITLIAFTIMFYSGFAQNYIPNAIFSSPATEWVEMIAGTVMGFSASDSHTADGSGCYIVVSNGSFNSHILQNISSSTLPSGSTFTIKYWVKGAASVKVQSRPFSDKNNVLGITYTIQQDDTWELVEEVYPFNPSANIIVKFFNRINVPGTTVKFDDVSLELGNTLSVKNNEKNIFSVYPTVTSDYLTIKSKTGSQIDNVEFYSITCQKVRALNLSKDKA